MLFNIKITLINDNNFMSTHIFMKQYMLSFERCGVIVYNNSHFYDKTFLFVKMCVLIKEDTSHFYDKTLSFVKMCFIIKDDNTRFYDKYILNKRYVVIRNVCYHSL